MPPPPEVVDPAPSAGRSLEVAVGAVALVVGFRAGLLPGGLVGVAVGLALLGWWVGASVASGSTPGAVLRAAWRPTWPPVLVALGLSCVWVLATDDAGLHVVARGQGLALVAGYLNWHVLEVGPGERWGARSATPLQHLWWLAAAAQALLVALALAAATRPRARRRTGRRDPLVAVALVAGLVGEVTAVALAIGADDRLAATVATPGPAAALLLGIAAGARLRGGPDDGLDAVVDGLRWPAAAILAIGAVLARPGTALAATFAAIAPVVAVAVAVGFARRPPDRAPARRARRRAQPVVDPWYLLVAVAVVHGTCVALAAAVVDPAPVVALLGLVLTAGVACATAVTARHLSDDRADVERRLVLVPPIAAGCLVLLLSLTGAFHWTDTGPRGPTPTGFDG